MRCGLWIGRLFKRRSDGAGIRLYREEENIFVDVRARNPFAERFARCPHCSSRSFLEGPSAGLAVNIECEGCGARFNIFNAPGGPYLDRQLAAPDPGRLNQRLQILKDVGRR